MLEKSAGEAYSDQDTRRIQTKQATLYF